jgi:hypothetical protein
MFQVFGRLSFLGPSTEGKAAKDLI